MNRYNATLAMVRVDRAIKEALKKRAASQRIGLAEAHRQVLAEALLPPPPKRVVGQIGPERYAERQAA